MGVNGNKKGKNWERELCHKLEEQFDDKFKRVPASGAHFGGSNISRAEGIREDAKEILSGDLICPLGFPFSIECKSYKAFPFHKILQGECKELDEWIEQARQDASLSDKEFIVFMKFNNIGAYVCLDLKNIKKMPLNFMVYKNKYILMTMETFFDLVDSIDGIADWKKSKLND